MMDGTATKRNVRRRLPTSGPTVSEIFHDYGERFLEAHTATKKQLKVMYAVTHCRDGTFGFHRDVCDTCGYSERGNNSCRDRHCPTCNESKRRKWFRARLELLLPIPYYHIVFTIPHDFNPLVFMNPELIYNFLMDFSAETLNDFARDPRHLGARIGFYGLLHTWGAKLWRHPHVHFMVTGGGLTDDGKWVGLRHKGKFMFPVQALSKAFRAKFIEALKAAHKSDQIRFPYEMGNLQDYEAFDKWLYHVVPKKWVVFAKSPMAGSEKVLRYLSLYTNRAAISNERVRDLAPDGQVTFDYKRYDPKTQILKWHQTRLTAIEFIRRFLIHVLPSGFHRVRHYGFLANGKSKDNVRAIRLQLPEDSPRHKRAAGENKIWRPPCPACDGGSLIPAYIRHPGGIRIVNYMALQRLFRPAYADTS